MLGIISRNVIAAGTSYADGEGASGSVNVYKYPVSRSVSSSSSSSSVDTYTRVLLLHPTFCLPSHSFGLLERRLFVATLYTLSSTHSFLILVQNNQAYRINTEVFQALSNHSNNAYQLCFHRPTLHPLWSFHFSSRNSSLPNLYHWNCWVC